MFPKTCQASKMPTSSSNNNNNTSMESYNIYDYYKWSLNSYSFPLSSPSSNSPVRLFVHNPWWALNDHSFDVNLRTPQRQINIFGPFLMKNCGAAAHVGSTIRWIEVFHLPHEFLDAIDYIQIKQTLVGCKDKELQIPSYRVNLNQFLVLYYKTYI